MASKVKQLKNRYYEDILPELQKTLGIKNINAVPKVEKVIVNVGIGKLLEGGKDYSEIVENVSLITGQKPVVAKARKSISNFKLREGMPVGVFSTLRGQRMYDFLNKLVNVTLPRTRDFRGISPKSFDGKGNYSLAIKEHTVFPEINPDDIVKIHGLQITVVTSAKDNQQAYELLKAMGFPFQAPIKSKTDNQ
ncbi:50S ribosomal protein L5 [Candidatus Peregrinibacteria bacterium]|nr:50S ribosomal protein L5 [Candidatus Peregrinibacteria bacterium]